MSNFVDVGLPTRIDVVAPDPDNPHGFPDDAYPAIIEDARHAYRVTTYDELVAWQAAWIAGASPPHPRERPAMTVTPDPRPVVPRINASRWIADCPNCHAANAVWQLGPPMLCLACGCQCKVAWGDPKERAAAIRIIADWPTEHRSWDAHKGETVEELKVQAVLMQGVAPDLRNGLLVAAGVTLPDDLTSPQDYLDRLQTVREKKNRGG